MGVFREEAETMARAIGMDEDTGGDLSEAQHMVVSTRGIAFAELCEVHAQMGYGFMMQYRWESGVAKILQDNGVVAFIAPCSHPDNSYHVMYFTQG